MENNIYENEAVAETEQLQPEVQEVEIQQPEAPQSAEKKLDVKKILNDGVDKAKELWANREALLQKVKSVPKKIWIMAGAGILALLVVIVVLSLQGNTYKTPIAAAEKLLNMKSFGKLIDNAPSVLNGFGESEADKIIKILKKSDQYQDIKEDAEDAVDDLVEMLKDEYGSNYKIKIKIEDKEKLEKEDVKEFRDQLRSIADMTKELDELDSDDYEDMADGLGISKSQAKEVIKTAKSFGKGGAGVGFFHFQYIQSKTGGIERSQRRQTHLQEGIIGLAANGKWKLLVFFLGVVLLGKQEKCKAKTAGQNGGYKQRAGKITQQALTL